MVCENVPLKYRTAQVTPEKQVSKRHLDPISELRGWHMAQRRKIMCDGSVRAKMHRMHHQARSSADLPVILVVCNPCSS